MALYPKHSPASAEALELGYEPQALRVRGLVVFLILFALAGVVMHLFLWKVMKIMERGASRDDVPRSIVKSSQRPPEPNLQPSVGHDRLPYQDMEELRRREDALLQKFGWKVDTEIHQAEIPPEIVGQGG